jgi:hypothetical protein
VGTAGSFYRPGSVPEAKAAAANTAAGVKIAAESLIQVIPNLKSANKSASRAGNNTNEACERVLGLAHNARQLHNFVRRFKSRVPPSPNNRRKRSRRLSPQMFLFAF